MYSESVCLVARSWVDVGRFSYAFSGEVNFYSVSPEYFGLTPVRFLTKQRSAVAHRRSVLQTAGKNLVRYSTDQHLTFSNRASYI
jgi:hypothetical protein